MTKAFGFSLLVLAALPAAAQVGELGITGGVTYYIGDLNPYRHYPKNTHPGFGLMYRYNFNERYAIRFQGLYSNLEAYDYDSPDPLQQLRNLGFRSVLFEGSALMEVNFFKYRGLAKDRGLGHPSFSSAWPISTPTRKTA